MQWSSILQMTIIGGGLFIVWSTFRMRRTLVNYLGMKAWLRPAPLFVMAGQAEPENAISQPVPDGQERLATQIERDDINEKIAREQLTSTSEPPLGN